MWDEILNKFDPSKSLLIAILKWNGDILSLKEVSRGINLVYSFKSNEDNLFLRVTHNALRKEQELLASISFLQHLYHSKVPVCEPMLSKNNLWVEKIWQDNECFLVHVCREVPGEIIDFNRMDLELYSLWGRSLAKLHRASMKYEINEFQYISWLDSLNEMHEYIKNESEEIQKAYYSVDEFFRNMEKSKYNYGLTHGDHREANVLTEGKNIYFIDFDVPCKNWFMEDFCRPFFDSIVYNKSAWIDKFEYYLAGYLEVMPKESVNLNNFIKHIQLKSLEIYLWTKNNWVGEKSPGNNDTEQWLERILRIIICDEWIKSLPNILK